MMTREQLFEKIKYHDVIVVDNQRGRSQTAGVLQRIIAECPASISQPNCVSWSLGIFRLNEFGKLENEETVVDFTTWN